MSRWRNVATKTVEQMKNNYMTWSRSHDRLLLFLFLFLTNSTACNIVLYVDSVIFQVMRERRFENVINIAQDTEIVGFFVFLPYLYESATFIKPNITYNLTFSFL